MSLLDRLAKPTTSNVTVILKDNDGNDVMPWQLRAGQVIERTEYSHDSKLVMLTVGEGRP